MLKVEIDEGSGFCFGVTTAIRKTEEELAKSDTLYCLGDIVHNGRECERLKQLGLNTRLSAETGDISFDDGTVLIFKATDVVKCAYTWDGCENFFLAKEYVLNHLNYE